MASRSGVLMTVVIRFWTTSTGANNLPNHPTQHALLPPIVQHSRHCYYKCNLATTHAISTLIWHDGLKFFIILGIPCTHPHLHIPISHPTNLEPPNLRVGSRSVWQPCCWLLYFLLASVHHSNWNSSPSCPKVSEDLTAKQNNTTINCQINADDGGCILQID